MPSLEDIPAEILESIFEDAMYDFADEEHADRHFPSLRHEYRDGSWQSADDSSTDEATPNRATLCLISRKLYKSALQACRAYLKQGCQGEGSRPSPVTDFHDALFYQDPREQYEPGRGNQVKSLDLCVRSVEDVRVIPSLLLLMPRLAGLRLSCPGSAPSLRNYARLFPGTTRGHLPASPRYLLVTAWHGLLRGLASMNLPVQQLPKIVVLDVPESTEGDMDPLSPLYLLASWTQIKSFTVKGLLGCYMSDTSPDPSSCDDQQTMSSVRHHLDSMSFISPVGPEMEWSLAHVLHLRALTVHNDGLESPEDLLESIPDHIRQSLQELAIYQDEGSNGGDLSLLASFAALETLKLGIGCPHLLRQAGSLIPQQLKHLSLYGQRSPLSDVTALLADGSILPSLETLRVSLVSPTEQSSDRSGHQSQESAVASLDPSASQDDGLATRVQAHCAPQRPVRVLEISFEQHSSMP